MQSISLRRLAVSAAFACGLSMFFPAVDGHSQENTRDCSDRLIGDYARPDTPLFVEVLHYSSSADHKRDLSVSSIIDIGEAIFVHVQVAQKDIPCKSGWVELADLATANGNTRRIAVHRIEGPALPVRFRSGPVTIQYEQTGGSDAFLIGSGNPPGKIAARAGGAAVDYRVDVRPPIAPGTARLSVGATSWDDERFAENSELKDGRLIISGPDGFEVTEDSTIYSGTVPAGNYTAAYAVMGVRAEAKFVVEAGVERSVEIKGSYHFGAVGWKSELRQDDFFQRIMGYERRPVCSYSVAGKVVLATNCHIGVELPKGKYDLEIAPLLIPKPFKVEVSPGKRRERDPEIGVLSVHDSAQGSSGPRNLAILVRAPDGASATFELRGDAKHMLPVGAYSVSVTEGRGKGTLEHEVEIKSAQATILELGEVPRAEDELACPPEMVGFKAAKDWPEACGTGLPPYDLAARGIDGLWDVSAPGNPFLDELLIAFSRSYGGVGWRTADTSMVVVGNQKKKGADRYFSGYGHGLTGISFEVGADGSISLEYGQYGYCGCRPIKFLVKPTGDPDVMTGTWTYGDDTGMSIWRRRPAPTIHSAYFHNASYDPAQRVVRDRVAFGERPLRIERDHEITCGYRDSEGRLRAQMRGNCDSVWVTILGENFAGGQHVWMDPATHMELWAGGWVCADGSFNSWRSNWYLCGGTHAAGDGVVGISVKLIFWDGIRPGPRTLWVNGKPIPIELTIHGYPDEGRDDAPSLVALEAFDARKRKMSLLPEGGAFVLQATFESRHPDPWVQLAVRPDGSATAADGSEAGDETTRSVLLMRTEDQRVFRSEFMVLRSGGQ